MIRTPDQRVRVFVSSTLEELAEERMVVKKAIEEMRLTPVMFELGARAHPPRQLYQSYLEQSDVFIGIYWNQYGWTASDMDISGLEDEYRLSGSKPKLIYVKSSNDRQSRLNDLIAEIEKQGTLAYKRFKDARELQDLIENDLAALLSERFLGKPREGILEQKIYFNSIPSPFHELIDRAAETELILDLIFNQQKRLISLIGMGGTGKSRLAIEIARRALPRFNHGSCFIGLASIKDHSHLESGIAMALGLADASKQSLRETLLSYLSDKNLLLVLDNFEHVLQGADLVSELLSRSRDLSILVTSRSALNLRAEHLIPLAPLPISEIRPGQLDEAVRIPALKLFIERANSVNPRIDWNKDNLDAISRICECLGGLPLAIELAAQRVRYSTPVLLFKGMEKTLDVLSGGARDLPGRQQSFRATLDWSYNLLLDEDKKIFRMLSIFQNGWFMDAVTAISGLSPEVSMTSMERLLDAGLIRLKSIEGGQIRYDMLQPIDEYSEELFNQDSDRDQIHRAYLAYYVQMVSGISPTRLTANYRKYWFPLFKADYENFRTAFRAAIRIADKKSACIIINALATNWMYEGLQNEGLRWIEESGIRHLGEWKSLPAEDILIFANGILTSGLFRFFPADFSGANHDLNLAKEMFEFIGEDIGVARCYGYLGLNGLSSGDVNSIRFFHEAIRIGTLARDYYSVYISTIFLAEYYVLIHDFEQARKQIDQAKDLLMLQDDEREYYGILDLEPMYHLEKGNVYLSLGDTDIAFDSYARSIRVFEEKKLKTSLGYALEGLAVIYLFRGEIEKAISTSLVSLNAGREQGDVIIALVSLKLLVGCLLTKDQSGKITELLDEIFAHFHYYNYSSWSSDALASKWVLDLLIQKNINYSFQPRARKLSFDELVQAVLAYYPEDRIPDQIS